MNLFVWEGARCFQEGRRGRIDMRSAGAACEYIGSDVIRIGISIKSLSCVRIHDTIKDI